MYKLLCAGDGGSVLNFVTEAAIRQSSDELSSVQASFLCTVHAHLLTKYCPRTSTYFSRLSLYGFYALPFMADSKAGPALAMASSQWMELQIRVYVARTQKRCALHALMALPAHGQNPGFMDDIVPPWMNEHSSATLFSLII